MIALPIPTGEAVPPIVGVIFAIAASLAFIVLVVQAVRYLRSARDDDHPNDQEKK
ncbi:MAG: hypothetical protein ABI566_06140 [Pseudolysinimonas sp.]